MLTLNIETGNSAFTENPESEAARILRELARHIESQHARGVHEDGGKLFDANGNSVGTWELTEGDE